MSKPAGHQFSERSYCYFWLTSAKTMCRPKILSPNQKIIANANSALLSRILLSAADSQCQQCISRLQSVIVDNALHCWHSDSTRKPLEARNSVRVQKFSHFLLWVKNSRKNASLLIQLKNRMPHPSLWCPNQPDTNFQNDPTATFPSRLQKRCVDRKSYHQTRKSS